MQTSDAGMDYGASPTLNDLERRVGFRVCPLTDVSVPLARSLAYYADSELPAPVMSCQQGGTLETGTKTTMGKPCSLDYALNKCPVYKAHQVAKSQ